MRVDLLDTPALVGQIQDDWSALHDSLPDSTPFQSPAWLMAWWEHFGSGQLQVFAFRNESNELVGVVPCFLHEWQSRRQLTLIGSGISDFLDPPLHASFSDEIACLLRRELTRGQNWDVADFQDLSPASPLLSLGSLQEAMPCSEIMLDRKFNEYWSERPSGLRRNVRRYASKAEQVAPVEFAVANAYDDELFNALIHLHGDRWRDQGESGTIDANHSAAFLRQSAHTFATRGMLTFFHLTFQAATVAIIMAFPWRGVIYAYLSAFDPAFRELGFGRTLLYHALQHTCDSGYLKWNFLRGDEAYKSEWGACRTPRIRVLITHDG